MTKFKQIKISEANRDAIETALKAVNGKATAHTFVLFHEIESLAKAAEKETLRLLAKGEAPGAIFTAVSGEETARSYSYARTATYVELLRRSAGWYLSAVAGCGVYCAGGCSNLVLTAAQDAQAVARFRKRYTVARPIPV
jgi:hypothetical protein